MSDWLTRQRAMLADAAATARDVYAQYAINRERELPQVYNDGIARIVSINEGVFRPALAEVWTDPQGEHLVVFDRDVLRVLHLAEHSGRLVRTQLRRTNGQRAIWRALLLPPVDWHGDYPCVYCCAADAHEHARGWLCGYCHALMPRTL